MRNSIENEAKKLAFLFLFSMRSTLIQKIAFSFFSSNFINNNSLHSLLLSKRFFVLCFLLFYTCDGANVVIVIKTKMLWYFQCDCFTYWCTHLIEQQKAAIKTELYFFAAKYFFFALFVVLMFSFKCFSIKNQ